MPYILDHAAEIATIEQDDGGGDEVEGCGAGLLVLEAAVAASAEAVEGDGTGKAVARFALVQFGGDGAPQVGVLKPAQGEQGTFDPPDLAQGRSKPALLTLGREFAEDQ